VLQGFISAGKGFRYSLDLVEVLIDPKDVEDDATVIKDAIRRYATNVESYVRRTPTLMTGI
jgi:hypothetical protein